MRMYEIAGAIIFTVMGLLLLFAPNPDLNGDGKGEVLRVGIDGVKLESSQ